MYYRVTGLLIDERRGDEWFRGSLEFSTPGPETAFGENITFDINDGDPPRTVPNASLYIMTVLHNNISLEHRLFALFGTAGIPVRIYSYLHSSRSIICTTRRFRDDRDSVFVLRPEISVSHAVDAKMTNSNSTSISVRVKNDTRRGKTAFSAQ